MVVVPYPPSAIILRWYCFPLATCVLSWRTNLLGLIVTIKGQTTLPWWSYIVALIFGTFITVCHKRFCHSLFEPPFTSRFLRFFMHVWEVGLGRLSWWKWLLGLSIQENQLQISMYATLFETYLAFDFSNRSPPVFNVESRRCFHVYWVSTRLEDGSIS